jgi:hypothetical protein
MPAFEPSSERCAGDDRGPAARFENRSSHHLNIPSASADVVPDGVHRVALLSLTGHWHDPSVEVSRVRGAASHQRSTILVNETLPVRADFIPRYGTRRAKSEINL